MDGARSGGRLNEAKMVIQSLAAKSAYETPGIGRAETVPYMRANWLSLYKHRDRLVADVARNLDGPEEVLEYDLLAIVDFVVSIALAVMYVPPYRVRIRRKGFEVRKMCELRRRDLSEALREGTRALLPDAFSMIALYTVNFGVS